MVIPGAGKLDSAYFASLVKKNSDAFLETKPFGYKEANGGAKVGLIGENIDLAK